MSDTKTTNTMKTNESQDDFFVGYLPVPTGLTRWLRRITLLTLTLAAAAAAVIAGRQGNPGDGVWTLDQQEAWEGVLVAKPYPMLRMTRGSEMRTILLVSEGKVGAGEQAGAFDGKAVRIRGTLIKRDGRHLVELVNEPEAIVAIGGADAGDTTVETATTVPAPWQRVELRGEIIDPKCYLGVMKPGEGKTHKACAALCLRGGIPPMFVSFDDTGVRRYFLIVSESGEAVTGDDLEALIAHVGEAVRVNGESATLGDMTLLKLRGSDVERD